MLSSKELFQRLDLGWMCIFFRCNIVSFELVQFCVSNMILPFAAHRHHPSVKELKQIQSGLARIGHMLLAQNMTSQAPSSSRVAVSAESIQRGMHSLPSSAKKARHLTRVRAFFFVDAACTVYHQALLDELAKELSEGSTSGTASVSSASRTPQRQAATTTASTSAISGNSNSRKRPTPSSSAPTPAPVLQFPPHHFPHQSFGFPPSFMPPNNFMTHSYAAQFPPSFHSAASARSRAQDEVARFSEILAAHQSNTPLPSHTPNVTSNSTNHASRNSTGSQATEPSSSQPRSNEAGPAFAAFAASVLANSNNSEASGNDNSGPRSPQEAKLFLELTQMGFQDRDEVLNAIRHFTDNSNNDDTTGSGSSSDTVGVGSVTSEQVMMWIISQREEAEEAKKMDLARFQSEELRKEQAERRKQEKENRIGSASLDVLAQTMFPKSWVLKRMAAAADIGGRNCGSMHALVVQVVQRALKDSTDDTTKASVSLKKTLIQLLELEKNALKWYNCLVPRAYFENWCKELMDRYSCHPDAQNHDGTSDSPPPSTLMSWMKKELEKEITKLETAMYSRPSEDENVPKIFTIAHEESQRQGSGNAYGDSDDDDDVIIILDSSSESSSPTNNNASSDRKQSPCSPNSRQNGVKSQSSASPS